VALLRWLSGSLTQKTQWLLGVLEEFESARSKPCVGQCAWLQCGCRGTVLGSVRAESDAWAHSYNAHVCAVSTICSVEDGYMARPCGVEKLTCFSPLVFHACCWLVSMVLPKYVCNNTVPYLSFHTLNPWMAISRARTLLWAHTVTQRQKSRMESRPLAHSPATGTLAAVVLVNMCRTRAVVAQAISSIV
jgi:hypothetical protein